MCCFHGNCALLQNISYYTTVWNQNIQKNSTKTDEMPNLWTSRIIQLIRPIRWEGLRTEFCWRNFVVNELFVNQIMIDYTETGCEVGRWTKLAQNRVQWRRSAYRLCHTDPVSVTHGLICMCNKQANVSCKIGKNAFETRVYPARVTLVWVAHTSTTYWMKDPSAPLFEDQTPAGEIHSSGTRVHHAKNLTLHTDRYAQIAFLAWQRPRKLPFQNKTVTIHTACCSRVLTLWILLCFPAWFLW